jgi:acetyl esterase/lipase
MLLRLASFLIVFGASWAFFPAEGIVFAQASRKAKTTAGVSLPEARRGFRSQLVPQEASRKAAPEPPSKIYRKVRYKAQAGELAAYLSPDPGDGKKHPAIVWINGGDCNSIDEGAWTMTEPENDQSASAYRKAGIIMMWPSLRGGNDNPGAKEGFLGEVNDVLAASDYLSRQSYVDPGRIYLGGHSTGGTLALLVAASTDHYRAVFSFGPASEVDGYLHDYLPFNTRDRREVALRSPGLWLHSIKNRTFVFEGTTGIPNYLGALEEMKGRSKNPAISFFTIKNGDHFNILAAINQKIADKILKDEGSKTNISFADGDFANLFSGVNAAGGNTGGGLPGRFGGMRERPSRFPRRPGLGPNR